MALNEILATQATQFIDIALGVVGILIFYYIFRLFTVGHTRDDTSDVDRQEAASRWLHDKKEAGKRKKATHDRKSLLEPATGLLWKAEQALEKLRNDSFRERTARNVKQAHSRAKTAESNIESAASVIRVARSKAKGEKRREIQKLYDSCEATLEHVRNNILHEFPDHNNAVDWDTDVKRVKDNSQEVIGFIGQLITAIHEFIDNDRLSSPDITRPGGRRRHQRQSSPSPGY
jgi:hypothetical protein